MLLLHKGPVSPARPWDTLKLQEHSARPPTPGRSGGGAGQRFNPGASRHSRPACTSAYPRTQPHASLHMWWCGHAGTATSVHGQVCKEISGNAPVKRLSPRGQAAQASRVSSESQGLEAAPAIAGMSQPKRTAVFAPSLCPWVLRDATTLLSRPRQQGGGSHKAAVPTGGPSAGVYHQYFPPSKFSATRRALQGHCARCF